MRRAWVWAGAAGLALVAPLAGASPNLLVIIADDLGVDKVGAYADDPQMYRSAPAALPSTPTLDALAASGLRFTQAWSNPMCSPTRAGLLTGRHAFRTGVGSPIPSSPELDVDTEVTLAELLSDPSLPQPYATAAFGKWHLGSTGAMGTTDWTHGTSGTSREIADTPHPLRAGFGAYSGNLRSAPEDYFRWTRVWAEGEGVATSTIETEYATWRTTGDALEWIDGQTGPWFALVSYAAAHADGPGIVYEADDSEVGCHAVTCAEDGTCPDERYYYQALVECLDVGVGDLLAGIAPETLDDTVVVFLGDNGTESTVIEGAMALTGGRSDNGKGTVYQSGVRVPLLIADGQNLVEWLACSPAERFAGTCALSDGLIRDPGRVVASPVHTTDLFATLADIAGVSAATGTDSESLGRCFDETGVRCARDPALGPRVVYTETFDYLPDGSGGESTTLNAAEAAIRDQRFKLVLRWDPTGACLTEELYDLARDPSETHDLVRAAADPKAALEAELAGLAPTWMGGLPICP